jgi:hypothetical protein
MRDPLLTCLLCGIPFLLMVCLVNGWWVGVGLLVALIALPFIWAVVAPILDIWYVPAQRRARERKRASQKELASFVFGITDSCGILWTHNASEEVEPILLLHLFTTFSNRWSRYSIGKWGTSSADEMLDIACSNAHALLSGNLLLFPKLWHFLPSGDASEQKLFDIHGSLYVSREEIELSFFEPLSAQGPQGMRRDTALCLGLLFILTCYLDEIQNNQFAEALLVTTPNLKSSRKRERFQGIEKGLQTMQVSPGELYASVPMSNSESVDT